MNGLSEKEIENIISSESFSELSETALQIIERLQQPLGQISGPISTGGKGNIEDNLKEFNILTLHLKEHGIEVFDIVPFEKTIGRLKNLWHKETNNYNYCMPILEEFYRPIIKSGHIKYFFFLPNWRTSYGSKWEHKECSSHGVKIIYLPENWKENKDFLNEI